MLNHSPSPYLNISLSLKIFLSCLLSIGIAACSTLPPQQPQPIQSALSTDTRDTSLAKMIQPLRLQHPDLTGYHILSDPLDALAARISLINQAEKTLDLQYYIWNNDRIGALALYSILQAANRGVKVRLLIDDNNAKEMEGIFLVLDQHPNIDIKLYNPYRFRHYRAIDMLLDLKRINRRMHNKSFIVDNQIALIGGRNMSDQYYNLGDNYQFADVDVMLVGQSSDQVINSFDNYWNDDYAYPVKQLVNPQQYRLDYDNLTQQLAQNYKEISTQNYLDLAYHSQAFERNFNQLMHFNWTQAEVFSDPPEKIKGTAVPAQYLGPQLLAKLEKPEHHLDIISAYFVPGKEGTAQLNALAQQGVKVRILTNSFKANDVPIVHAFYSKYRPDLLDHNVQLYEFLYSPDQEVLHKDIEEIAQKIKVNIKGLSHASLHAKLFAIDDKQVFIGSPNFDPRSAYLNSEIGVLLNSPTLAQGIHQAMNQNLSHYAYKLLLNADHHINWQVEKNTKDIREFKTEPRMRWYQKAALKVLSWLPIEGFM
ncbi:phospholipase D family protein [Acinetobacter sp. SAAs470]|uniref:phospholipase D family protein n=1 Tax=unclassified Acinetobacter TaxID=196816 RepID=UPI003977AECE